MVGLRTGSLQSFYMSLSNNRPNNRTTLVQLLKNMWHLSLYIAFFVITCPLLLVQMSSAVG